MKWADIDFENQVIRVERTVTHPRRNRPEVKDTKTEASRRTIDLVPQVIPYLHRGAPEDYVLGGREPLTYTQTRRMCERIQRNTGFEENITPRRFRTTVLTDLYDATKDIKQAQAAAGHTTAAMTLKHYCQGKIGTDEHRRAHCKRLRVGKLTKKLVLAKPKNRCGTGLLRRPEAQKTDEKADKIRGNDM